MTTGAAGAVGEDARTEIRTYYALVSFCSATKNAKSTGLHNTCRSAWDFTYRYYLSTYYLKIIYFFGMRCIFKQCKSAREGQGEGGRGGCCD